MSTQQILVNSQRIRKRRNNKVSTFWQLFLVKKWLFCVLLIFKKVSKKSMLMEHFLKFIWDVFCGSSETKRQFWSQVIEFPRTIYFFPTVFSNGGNFIFAGRLRAEKPPNVSFFSPKKIALGSVVKGLRGLAIIVYIFREIYCRHFAAILHWRYYWFRERKWYGCCCW